MRNERKSQLASLLDADRKTVPPGSDVFPWTLAVTTESVVSASVHGKTSEPGGTVLRSASRRLASWLFLSFLIFYVALTRGHFFLTDAVQVYQQTRSLL